MSNKQQGAEELIEDYIKIPVKKAIAEKSTIYVETAIKFAEAYHTQKRAEELEGITEEVIEEMVEIARRERTWRMAVEEIINHLKNKE